MHIFRNLVRMPKSTLLIFAIVFTVLFLEMFGGFIGNVCDECLEKVYGPLQGWYTVDTEGVFTYDGAKYISENVDNIEAYQAFCTKTGNVYHPTLSVDGTLSLLASNHSLVEYTESAITRGSERGAFNFTGVTSCEYASEFYSGKYLIVKGRALTREDDEEKALAVLVSDVIAEKNGLDIGSPLRIMTDKFNEGPMPAVYKYEMYVVGIYHCNEPDNSAYSTLSSAVNTNVVFLPLSVMENEILGNSYRSNIRNEDIFPQRVYFKLTPGTDPDELATVLRSLNIRPFTLSEFSGEADDSPIAKMSGIVRYCSFAVLAAGAVMLVVVVVLSIHSRRREISILCALGKRRSGVTLQLIGEFTVIFIAAAAVSFGLFSALVWLTEPILTSYINVAQETSVIVNTSSLSYRPGETASVVLTATPFSRLFSDYIVPNLKLAVLTGAIELITVALLLWIYIRNTEVLATLGGKT